MLKKLLILCFSLFCIFAKAQETGTIYGTVKDSTGFALQDVNVQIENEPALITFTDFYGSYKINVPAGKELIISFSLIGSEKRTVAVRSLNPAEKYKLDMRMPRGINMRPVVISVDREKEREKIGVITIDPKAAQYIPTTGRFEDVLKTLPGVTSNNELSSQYNVRGGNYDENLVYVNDMEIYRPQLVRSGQQEGLSFINPDLIESIKFSSGGFDARYGDKMSSVLDITYKKPIKSASTLSLSLLGVNAHTEGSSKNKRFTYLFGSRYRSNQYLLNSLDVQGDYKPSFSDVQTYLTYHLTSELNISFLGSFANNRYLIIPQSRYTSFGTVTNALQLFIGFEGQELMKYQTTMGGLTLAWQPTKNTTYKWMASAFNSREQEFFTVEGGYRLDQLDSDFGSETFGQAVKSLGFGYFINHARNELEATVYNISHRAYHECGRNKLQWGLHLQHEQINDKIREWSYADSNDFSVPVLVNNEFVLAEFVNSQQTLQSNRISGYIQNAQTLNEESNMIFAYGLRSNYWDLNNQNVVSPRMQFSFEPNRRYNRKVFRQEIPDTVLRRDIVLKAAVGYYYQPPFYREIRNLEGKINRNVKAQRSIHFVLGGDMNFKAWKRPFKLFSEIYYKKLDNLVPYEIDNVRIRYYAQNLSHGYAAGIDTRVNGEFVKGMESWASLSLMQTQEDIKGDFYIDQNGNRVEPGFIPRPTDQRFNFGLFFQDNFLRNESFKMHLSLIYGSRLPFGPPDYNKYKDTLRMPAYKRVDIGFSKMLIDENKDPETRHGLSKVFKSAWLSLEVFNLLQFNNTISYIWVKDIENRQYAVPNYLTSRRINLHLILRF